MKEGLEYLKGLKKVTNKQIIDKLTLCCIKNGGGANCPDRAECRVLYEKYFTGRDTTLVWGVNDDK